MAEPGLYVDRREETLEIHTKARKPINRYDE